MGQITIDTIMVTPLARIATPGGDVMHAMKQSDEGFSVFGEAYFSWINAGSVKAWKRHKRMIMNIVVPVGNVRFVFFKDENSGFRIEEIGENNYARLTVPPGIWFGFQSLEPKSLVMNISSILHDSEEVDRLLVTDLKYNW
jgi:dTDP-4-dehydrorhamnose 3,5-epimerase